MGWSLKHQLSSLGRKVTAAYLPYGFYHGFIYYKLGSKIPPDHAPSQSHLKTSVAWWYHPASFWWKVTSLRPASFWPSVAPREANLSRWSRGPFRPRPPWWSQNLDPQRRVCSGHVQPPFCRETHPNQWKYMEIQLRYIYVITFGRVLIPSPKDVSTSMGPQGFLPGWSFSPCRWPPPRRAGCCRCRGWWPRRNSMEPGRRIPPTPKGPQGTPRTPSHLRCDLVTGASWWSIVIGKNPIKNLQPIQIALFVVSIPMVHAKCPFSAG